MKKVLLATTAVVGAVMFTQAALAEVKVTTGGYLEFAAGIFDNDGANESSRDFQTEAEVDFRAAGKADNGLEYSAEIQFRNDGGDVASIESNLVNVDEAYLTFAGNWGKVELGDTDGAVRNMAVYAPVIGFHQIDTGHDLGGANYSDYLGGTSTGVRNVNSGDSTKISYYTPKWSGFQAGVSYAPEFDEGQNVIISELAGGSAVDYENIWEAAVTFGYDFRDVGILIGGTLSTADSKETILGVATFEDFMAWSVGAQVTWAGFTFGGAYVDDDEAFAPTGTGIDSNAWNIGVSYETGPLGVAASWITSEVDGPGYELEEDAYGVGATYKVAPGLVVQGDLMFQDTEETTAGITTLDTNGWVLLLGTRMTF